MGRSASLALDVRTVRGIQRTPDTLVFEESLGSEIFIGSMMAGWAGEVVAHETGREAGRPNA